MDIRAVALIVRAPMAASAPTETSPTPGSGTPSTGSRIGVLLINLGSPSGTDYWSVRRYLREFLSDRRVIETPRLLWWFILNLVVLTVRPSRSGHAYAQIWDKARNESPLIVTTRRQAEKLTARMAGDKLIVDWAMRYGAPAIGARLAALRDAGCERILIAPLYPQYAAATTATANDTAFAALRAVRWQPAVRTLPAYYDDPAYIDALAASFRRSLADLSFEPEVVLASYHGLPQAYVEKGDPYHRQCMETTRLLRDKLGWSADKLQAVFQSRFGRAEWVRPYTDVTIAELADRGVKRLAVVMPGFSSDCLETLEEIAIRAAGTFRRHGGVDFAAIPCLNDGDDGMALIETLVRRELSGWLQA